VNWEPFERAALRYEDWYATPRGRRASRAETQLLDWLLDAFPQARSVLDVGCGTGHFTAWLAQCGLRTIGLDRAPAMLMVLRRQLPGVPALLADAHALPVRDRGVDLVVLIATLEFLEDPRGALLEAVRVARRGVVVVALNRWSVGALSRRIGPAARGTLLSRAHDLSAPELRRLLREAAAKRLTRLRTHSALLPQPLPAGPTPIPLGDVVGVAAELRSE
jgi:ubiquinone/menaquinone biosynthesis C-methylase UbiE